MLGALFPQTLRRVTVGRGRGREHSLGACTKPWSVLHRRSPASLRHPSTGKPWLSQCPLIRTPQLWGPLPVPGQGVLSRVDCLPH